MGRSQQTMKTLKYCIWTKFSKKFSFPTRIRINWPNLLITIFNQKRWSNSDILKSTLRNALNLWGYTKNYQNFYNPNKLAKIFIQNVHDGYFLQKLVLDSTFIKLSICARKKVAEYCLQTKWGWKINIFPIFMTSLL